MKRMTPKDANSKISHGVNKDAFSMALIITFFETNPLVKGNAEIKRLQLKHKKK